VRKAFPLHLAYETDTSASQSGSPVYENTDYVIGVHTNTLQWADGTYNWCDNITRDRFNLIVSYMN